MKRRQNRNSIEKLDEFCERHEELYLYGAGEYGELFYDVLTRICDVRNKLAGFIDTYKTGKNRGDCPKTQHDLA